MTQAEQWCLPRLVVSGLSGGGGKTLVALGLARAWSRKGLRVKPCKKGPDYIDAAWLACAADCHCVNLDPFFLNADRLRALLAHAAHGTDVALIEGNRGLYDGRDLEGSCSTATLARCLDAPVLLTLNCTKMTRTAAAVVAGMAAFEPVFLGGVILNQVGSARHGSLARRAIETYTDVPVLGEIPRLPKNPLPERHMGLMGVRESDADEETQSRLDRLGDLLQNHTDLDAILALARKSPDLPRPAPFWGKSVSLPYAPVIGFVRDEALWFYYEENLEALRRAGAVLCELSLFDDKPWPHLDGLYLGGGFPENMAERLSASPRLHDLYGLSRQGLPLYAECGGFMVLCRSLVVGEQEFPMSGVFPARAVFHSRPQGLGYVETTADKDNAFHPQGVCWRGHEFHYSRCEALEPLDTVLRLEMGTGMAGRSHGDAKSVALSGRDGLVVGNTFASYTHLFAPAVPHWAPRFVALCLK